MDIWAIVGLKHNSWGQMIGMKKGDTKKEQKTKKINQRNCLPVKRKENKKFVKKTLQKPAYTVYCRIKIQ